MVVFVQAEQLSIAEFEWYAGNSHWPCTAVYIAWCYKIKIILIGYLLFINTWAQTVKVFQELSGF